MQIAEDFQTKTNFPNCIGAVDGKHIHIKRPENSGSSFYNYKQFFSIVLMALVDSIYCFTFVDVGAYGCCSDSHVFKNSQLAKRLQQNNFNIPEKVHLTNDTNGKPMPYVFVGDEAFALSEHILRPFAKKNLSMQKRVFNYRLSRARRMVECTFGLLANKWRIFHRPLDTSAEFCDDIIKSFCVLHNWVRHRDGK